MTNPFEDSDGRYLALRNDEISIRCGQPSLRYQPGGPSPTPKTPARPAWTTSTTTGPTCDPKASSTPWTASGRKTGQPLRLDHPRIQIRTRQRRQLNLEDHGGKTPSGVLQRILALTTAIWHNDRTGQPIKRSLLAYDH